MSFDITKMLQPEVYGHPVDKLTLIETHISWVILTGEFVYKIKKPVDFGFLDFSTLKKRHHFCEQEVLLNRRLAPGIYLDVVAIIGPADHPCVSTLRQIQEHEVIEYAVRMKQFPQSGQLDIRLSAGKLKIGQMDAVADMVAEFHQRIDRADESMPYGDDEVIYRPVAENFSQIRQHVPASQLRAGAYDALLKNLESWSRAEATNLKAIFIQRKADGFIRECHGDMHLRNLAWLDDSPVAFDCIEFNPFLRWIDVISEVAFLVMDLQHRQQPEMASRFLNRYLEITGDYSGLQVLRFYLCYRALVRAKVAALQCGQAFSSADKACDAMPEFASYVALASEYSELARPKLIIMRGLSASGKSTVSQCLLEASGAIRLRSDVERKRLFNIKASASGKANIDSGIYTEQASRKTYGRLLQLAEQIISSGHTVIVDAVFLKYEQRQFFQRLAETMDVGYIIVEVTAPEDVLRQRIEQRENDVSDADLKVLENQLANWLPLQPDELVFGISIDTAAAYDLDGLIKNVRSD